MSADPTQVLAFETDCHIFDGCGFPSPGLHSFLFDPLWGNGDSNVYFNKTMLLALLGSVVVIGFFWAAFRRPQVVPGKLQMVAETGYDFVRRGIVYETMGKRQGEKYVPLIVSLFFFVWMMNLWSIIPLAQFPVTSVFAYPLVLALLVYVVWVSLTFKKHGFVGALKNFTGYDKSLGAALPVVMLIEAFSNLLVRPFTHAVRLFANMFAGHILLVLFSTGGLYLIQNEGLIGAVAGPLAWLMAIAVGFLEVLVQVLQAYVFALLNAMYISGALADEH